MREIWIEATLYPDYRVSNLGNVVNKATGLPPKYFMRGGRKQLNLRLPNGEWALVQHNRLIASSFFEDSIDGYEINHKDGDRTNNAIWNLEISTREENLEHAYVSGLMKRPTEILNLDTGEVYSSTHVAGRKLGYLAPLKIPKDANEYGAVFVRGGYRLKIV